MIQENKSLLVTQSFLNEDNQPVMTATGKLITQDIVLYLLDFKEMMHLFTKIERLPHGWVLSINDCARWVVIDIYNRSTKKGESFEKWLDRVWEPPGLEERRW